MYFPQKYVLFPDGEQTLGMSIRLERRAMCQTHKKHGKIAQLPWHHNINLSFCFLAFIFCLFVFLPGQLKLLTDCVILTDTTNSTLTTMKSKPRVFISASQSKSRTHAKEGECNPLRFFNVTVVQNERLCIVNATREFEIKEEIWRDLATRGVERRDLQAVLKVKEGGQRWQENDQKQTNVEMLAGPVFLLLFYDKLVILICINSTRHAKDKK